jgi:hypothetical protein
MIAELKELSRKRLKSFNLMDPESPVNFSGGDPT